MKRKNGFTLLEVMIVLMLLVILAGAVTPAYLNYLKKARVQTAKSESKLLSDAVDHYYLEVGVYPSSLKALVGNADNNEKWDGPYIKGKLPVDPWGNAYILEVPGKEGDFDVISRGSDGKSGGDGDAADIFSSDIAAN
ncbi:MAG: type II secretion system major pseudopilin GspG [Victivallaceae bacterium]|nr:type II secretion system major pseudopilin GspG [Victivallaceae bacterium]